MRDKLCRLVNLNNDAFTLVELLIAIAMVGIVMGSIYGIFLSSNRSYHTQDRVADAQQRVRVGLDSMAMDIRMTGLDPLGTASAGIEMATATNLRFTADRDMDGNIEEANSERMTYAYDAVNSRLRLCLDEGTGSETWETLIDNVSALTFTYLDANDAVTADISEIRTVLISLTVQEIDAQGQPFTRALSSRVNCRNLSL